jgi:DHA1 family multidrug resistance protein-like MFS transporter
MFNGMGIQWAATLLGCVAAVLVPIPVLFYLYGHKLRARSSFAPTPAGGMGPPAADSPSDSNDAAAEASSGDRVEKEAEAQDHAALSNVPRVNREKSREEV